MNRERKTISVYTRAQAIADGTLVDVTRMAQEAGLKYPTAMTRSVWHRYVSVPDGVSGQDETGRLWDVLWVLRWSITVWRTPTSELLFHLFVRNDNHEGRLHTLKAVCGPGDEGEPVITILLPNED